MSASATAKQKLENLHSQLRAYQDKLQRQEQGLRDMQVHISQIRTVVDWTIPGEIDKAYGEYINTLDHCEKAAELRGRGGFRRRDALGGAVRVLFTAVIWARILVVFLGALLAGFLSATPLQWRAAY